MMKRIIALLLALILTVGLLPTVALAAEETANTNVVPGSIGTDGKWSQTPPTQPKVDGVKTVEKTAEKVAGTDNQYKVTLTVVLEQTKEEQKPGAAATVLVLDTSGSMAYCAECGVEEECEHSCEAFDGQVEQNRNYYYKNDKGEYEKAYYCDGKHKVKPNHPAGWFTTSGDDFWNHDPETDSLAGQTIYVESTTPRTSRLDAAKVAAENFLKTYSGLKFDTDGTVAANQTDRNLGRYVSVVTFATGVTLRRDWIDVSNPAGYENVLGVFTGNSLEAKGATNLDAGLTYAEYLLKKNTMKDAAKNVIALTDGEPTYYLSTSKRCDDYECDGVNNRPQIGEEFYYVHGRGDACSTNTKSATDNAANALKNNNFSDLYTICFGVANDKMKQHKDGNSIKYWPNSLTVGQYLQSIASSKAGKQFAYTADNAEQLNTAFAAITDTIVSGLDTGTVNDTLPTGITGSTATANGQAITSPMTWKLDDDDFDVSTNTETEGDKTVTTYTYTKTYYVTINPDAKGLKTTKIGGDLYAPLNGETTLTVEVDGKKETIPFPIPAGKVTPTKITDKITVTITGATKTETYDGTEKKAEGYTVTISDSRYTTNDFTFSGTDVVKATNASTNQYMMGLEADDFTNNNEKFTNVEFVVNDGWLVINKKELTIEANDNAVDYDGNPHGEDGYVATGLATGDNVTNVTISGSKTEPGTYENLLVPSEAVIKNAKGEDVKDNYIITYTPGTLVINKLTNEITVTITGTQETKEYNGQTQEVTGFTYTVDGADHDDVTVVLNNGEEAKASGKDVLVGTDGKYDATLTYPMHLTADDFNVSSTKYSNVTIKKVNDGWLKITPIAITLRSGDASKTYDGTALTNTTVNETGAFVTGEGLNYTVTGSQTEVGTSENTYTYAAKAGTTLTNYTITEEKGTLTVTLPDPSIPTVTIDCINHDVSHSDKTDITLTAATQYELGDPQKVTNESAYTRTITLTDAGKEYCIGDYNEDIAGHTKAAGGTTTITLKYSKEGSDWTWRAPANFLVNVQCNTPTVNVNLGNYIKKTLTGTNFHENFEATFTVEVTYTDDNDSGTATGSVRFTGADTKDFGFVSTVELKKNHVYKFTATELADNVPGVDYDTRTYSFALKITAEGDVVFGSVVEGVFVADKTDNKYVTITNTYTKPAYKIEKNVITDTSVKIPAWSLDYPDPVEIKVVVDADQQEIVLGYVIKITGSAGASFTLTEDEGSQFVTVHNADGEFTTVTPGKKLSFTLTQDHGNEHPILIYTTKVISRDPETGAFPAKVKNVVTEEDDTTHESGETTIEERGTLTVDFGALVRKHLTVTGDKSFNGATFTVNFTDGTFIKNEKENEPEISSVEVYAADAGVNERGLPNLTASVTYGADERNAGYKPFDGADLTIRVEGTYFYLVSEVIPDGATGYDTNEISLVFRSKTTAIISRLQE